VVLDLKQAAARAALLRLAASADVLIYNIRPQAMARLGLSYDEVKAAKKDIVYVGVYGYGNNGPYAERPAYDDLIQGASALPTLMARAGNDVPRYLPTVIADKTVGLYAVSVVTAALFHRQRSGVGQKVDIPMFETMAQFVLTDHMAGMTFDPPLGPAGYARLLAKSRKPYATKDGYLCVLIYNDKQWKSFLELVGRAELIESDPRFADYGARARNIDALYLLVEEHLATRTTAQWQAALAVADIPVMPLHTLESLMQDPHLAAVDFFKMVDHPSEGRMRSMAAPGDWSATQPGIRRHAPRLGEHSAELLREAGLGEAAIAALASTSATRLEN
jgi:crotonobetainyl-CoA:carnitine CoA-transferase CaiB-like acyl-CoA transferase